MRAIIGEASGEGKKVPWRDIAVNLQVIWFMATG